MIFSSDERFDVLVDGSAAHLLDHRANRLIGKPIGTLTGHLGPVTGFDAAPDGNLVASVSTDGTVRLWDPATFRATATLLGLPGGAWAVLLPDGTYKLDGNPQGELWWAMGLCRFQPGELDEFVRPLRRLAPTEPILGARDKNPPLGEPPAPHHPRRRRWGWRWGRRKP